MSAAATFCATLVDEWCRVGVRHAVIAPGSRSTPMALALAAREQIELHVVHDERAAAFVALGLGLDGVPAVLLCTSGTAATNFHPAVVEAGLSDVPMLVLTADRPPELRDVGAPQTIDQTHLFGRSVRWFHDPGVPDVAAAGTWRSLARRARRDALDGPVHLNLPFREPLVGDPDDLPGATAVHAPGPHEGPASSDRRPSDGLPAGFDTQRGVIVAGGRSGVSAEQLGRLAELTGWPLLADPISGARSQPGVVCAADALLRHREFADAHLPEVVVRVGRPPASKVVGEWIARSGAAVIQVGGPGTIDPEHMVTARCSIDVVSDAVTASGWRGAVGTPWAARWRHADDRALDAIARVLAAHDRLTEPEAARTVAEVAVTDGHRLVVASSMPVRDLEWYGGASAVAHSNRGANGIDGTLSTALGIALTGPSTIVLTGDIAFLHDANALVGIRHRRVDLRIVVVDNDGGGIFSFLPQAESLPSAKFELLFGTPHGTDLEQLAGAHGLAAVTVGTRAELVAALVEPGPSVVRIATDRATNVEVHRELHAAVAAALDRRP